MAMLDDKTVAAIKGPEPGKTVMRIKEHSVEAPGALWLRVTKRADKAGDERVSKSWEFFWTKPDGKLGCIGLGRWIEPPAAGKRQPPNTRTARQARIEADRLAETGVDRDLAEMMLGHKVGSEVTVHDSSDFSAFDRPFWQCPSPTVDRFAGIIQKP
jgi:hypothetical protein